MNFRSWGDRAVLVRKLTFASALVRGLTFASALVRGLPCDSTRKVR